MNLSCSCGQIVLDAELPEGTYPTSNIQLRELPSSDFNLSADLFCATAAIVETGPARGTSLAMHGTRAAY